MRSTPLFTLAALLFTTPVWAELEKSGQSLHDQHCLACHVRLTDGNPDHLYTRKDRRVTSAAGLARQVRLCDQNVGLSLFDEDLDAITQYLDKQYYHFSN